MPTKKPGKRLLDLRHKRTQLQNHLGALDRKLSDMQEERAVIRDGITTLNNQIDELCKEVERDSYTDNWMGKADDDSRGSSRREPRSPSTTRDRSRQRPTRSPNWNGDEALKGVTSLHNGEIVRPISGPWAQAPGPWSQVPGPQSPAPAGLITLLRVLCRTYKCSSSY